MRAWIAYALGLALIAISLALLLRAPKPTLTCERGETGDGTCTLVTNVFLLPQQRTFRAADLRGTRIELVNSIRNRHRLNLRLTYTEYPLSTRNDSLASQQALADQIAAYIADPTQRTLRLGAERNPVLSLIEVACALAGLRLIHTTWRSRSRPTAPPAPEAATPPQRSPRDPPDKQTRYSPPPRPRSRRPRPSPRHR